MLDKLSIVFTDSPQPSYEMFAGSVPLRLALHSADSRDTNLGLTSSAHPFGRFIQTGIAPQNHHAGKSKLYYETQSKQFGRFHIQHSPRGRT